MLINKRKLNDLYAHFASFGTVYYPVKANNHPVLLSILNEFGSSFEVDGIKSIEELIKINVSMEKILFSLPIKKQFDIDKSLDYGVTKFVVDTEREYDKITQSSNKRLTFLIRLAIEEIVQIPDLNEQKWGMPIRELKKLANRIQFDGNDFAGISFYLPKNVYTPSTFQTFLDQLIEHFKEFPLKIIDVGGGLDDNESIQFKNNIDNLKKNLNLKEIILEPGRNLLNPCIDILVSIIGIATRNQHKWIYIDSGVYSALLDSRLNRRYFDFKLFYSNDIKTENSFSYLISGSTSDTLDELGSYWFSCELKPDDLLLITKAGAYTYVFNTIFGNSDFHVLVYE